jgi:hypothetical protein
VGLKDFHDRVLGFINGLMSDFLNNVVHPGTDWANF